MDDLVNPETHEMTVNLDAKWVPDIPLPSDFWWIKRCRRCGMRFFTRRGYRGHYALCHILRLDRATMVWKNR